MDDERYLKVNGSGYPDPTAYRAIKNIEKKEFNEESERFYKLLYAIFNICELSDFCIEGRIQVKDKRTGKVWR